MWQAATGHESSFSSTDERKQFKFNKENARKSIAKLCQDKVSSPLHALLHRKNCQIFWPRSLKRKLRDAEDFGDFPGGQLSLSFLQFWKLPTLHFLYTQVIFTHSEDSDGVED